MSKRNKNQVPATPAEEVKEIAEGIKKASENLDSPLVNKEEYVNFVEEKLGEILEGTSAEKRIEDEIDKALEIYGEGLKPPVTGPAGLEEFDKALKSQVSNLTEGITLIGRKPEEDFWERFNKYGNDFVVPVNENGEYEEEEYEGEITIIPYIPESEIDSVNNLEDAEEELKSVVTDAATKLAMKRVFGIVEDHTVIDYNYVIQDHSTLLEYYQARKTVEGADLDFIPLDYVTLDEETGIVQNINFAFMIPFNVILGHINYITFDMNDFILGDNDVLGMPSRYDIIEHEATIEARFNVEGEYDVKTMFDESLTVLQSSLFSNHKVAK